MSDERQETVEDIVAEIRRLNPETFLVSKWCCEPLPNRMRSYADRIEAAYKRLALPTPEQWTEIARQGAEIADLKRENDALKREREAGAEAAQICGEIGEMVGREAACHQHVTDCHGLNTAAMREALVMVKRLFDGRLMWKPDIRKAHEAVNAALAAPPRNCDVGTEKEQNERFIKFCTSIDCKRYCPLFKADSCELAWAQMQYEEVKE